MTKLIMDVSGFLRNTLYPLLKWGLALVLGAHMLLFVAYAWFMLTHPVPILNSGESIVMAYARLAGHGIPLYNPALINDFPFPYPIYPPVFYYLNGLLMNVFGFTNTVGRAVSFVSALGGAALLGSIVRMRGGTRLAGMGTSLMFLAMLSVSNWALQNRVDMLALFFVLAAAWCWHRFPDGWPQAAGAAALLVVALFTKQSMLAMGVALVLSCCIKKEWRAALVLIALCVLGAIAIFLPLNHFTGGGFFLFAFKANSGIPLFWERGLGVFMGFLKQPLVPVGLGLLLYRSLWLRKFDFVFCFVMCSLALTLCLIGFFGSSDNYFLEICAALALLFGTMLTEHSGGGRSRIVVAALMALAFAANLVFVGVMHKEVHTGGEITKQRAAAIHEAAAFMGGRFGPDHEILYEDMQVQLVLDRPVHFYSGNDYNMHLRHGFYENDMLLESIERQRWAAVVVYGVYESLEDKPIPYFPWFTRGQLDAIDTYYMRLPAFNEKQTEFSLYIPRPRNESSISQ